MEKPLDSRIAQALDAMERRLSEPLRVADLAALANLSASRFAHLFRTGTGISPARYLQNLRLDRARVLLDRTSLPIRAVMLVVGCTDASHFSKDFRKRFGVCPRDYRREYTDVASRASERSHG